MRRFDWELFKIRAEAELAKRWWLYLLIGVIGLPVVFMMFGVGSQNPGSCSEFGRAADLFC